MPGMTLAECDAAWVHVWYRKAHRPEAAGALEKEWEAIVAALLDSD